MSFELVPRVAVYPHGTSVAAAAAAEAVKQASQGHTIDTESVVVLDEYFLPTAAGIQDVVAIFGSTVISYRLNP